MTQPSLFKLPDIGEGITEADIVRWHVRPGDHVTVNQIIVEIETSKAFVELPSPYTGVVDSLLVSEGDTAEVGTPIIAVRVGERAPATAGSLHGPTRRAQVSDAQIEIMVGGMVIQAEAVPAVGTELTSGSTTKVAAHLDTFQTAQDAIVQVARSTAQMIARTEADSRPDRVELEFGLGFTTAGEVLLAKVAGQASLKVSLAWNVGVRSAASGVAEADQAGEPGPGEAHST